MKEHDNAQSLIVKAKNPSKMILLSFDITNKSDTLSVYKHIEQHTKETGETFFALVNNAGVSGFGLFEWGSMEKDIKPVVKINLESSILVTRTFIPLLRKTKGARIINMTSYVTHVSVPFVSTYCISKCGLKAFSESLRKDFEDDVDYYNGMKVLTIEPTAYKTGILGYEQLRRTVRNTWHRTSTEVQSTYGQEIYDATQAFVSVCEFFKFFDFLAFKRNIGEVSDAVLMGLITQDPVNDIELVSLPTHIAYYFWWGFAPQEVLEAWFSFGAYFGFIFVFEVAVIKKIFNLL